MSNTKPGWGILATGWIAELFTQDLNLSGMNVAAVGSRSRDKAEAFAARFGIPSAHGSYEDLVADPGVDIVYIATPHPMHARDALLAIEAGKHVLVEKPFTLNAAEARKVIDRAKEKNLVVLEAMWTRFLPHMVQIREIIAEGKIGELRSLTAEHRQALPSDPAHRLNAPELGGGALLDLGIYPISFAWDLLGAPHRIETLARFGETGVDAEISILMEHAGGVTSSSVSALDCAGPNTAFVYGSKGRIEIDGTWYEPTSFRVRDYEGNLIEEFTETVPGRGMQFQALEMERLVREGTNSSIMPIEETLAIMEALDKIRDKIGLKYPGEV